MGRDGGRGVWREGEERESRDGGKREKVGEAERGEEGKRMEEMGRDGGPEGGGGLWREGKEREKGWRKEREGGRYRASQRGVRKRVGEIERQREAK